MSQTYKLQLIKIGGSILELFIDKVTKYFFLIAKSFFNFYKIFRFHIYVSVSFNTVIMHIKRFINIALA